MESLITRLKNLNVTDAEEIVADCVDFGRMHWLVDYINARERLYDMEVDTYVRQPLRTPFYGPSDGAKHAFYD